MNPSPYVAFKDDRERRRALFWRDVRLVLIAAIATAGTALSAASASGTSLVGWLTGFLH